MTESLSNFAQLILQNRKLLTDQLLLIPLRIAVLGPNLRDPKNIGSRKRRQITRVLRQDGHQVLLPEEVISITDPPTPLLQPEIEILSDDSVNLIIILYTKDSPGVSTEIGRFSGIPLIYSKTTILFPEQLFTPNESLIANTVQSYYTALLYTENDFSSCRIVAECRAWARSYRISTWLNLEPHIF